MAERESIDEVLDLMSRAIYGALLGGAEVWARLDITMPQLKVLMLLGLHESAPVSWLAARMNVSPPNVTGILDRLAQANWIERTNDPHDRRVVRVVLTEKGTQLLQELQVAGTERVRSSLSEMGQDDRTALRKGLSALLDHADTNPPATPQRRQRARQAPST